MSRGSRTKAADPIECILEPHTDGVRLLVDRIRAVIRRTVPSALESAHPVWHSIGYRHPEAGYFCGLFPLADRVDIAFEFGILLPDPEGLLAGNGKQVRYLRVRAVKDLRVRPLQQLLRAAISLPPARAVKLGMIRDLA